MKFKPYSRLRRHGPQIALIGLLILSLTASPAAAASVSDSMDCEVPESLQPLFDLLEALTELAFIAGVSLGTLGFTSAGLMIAAPLGEEWTRRGKELTKQVLIGTVILLSANMVVAFLVNELGGVVCS